MRFLVWEFGVGFRHCGMHSSGSSGSRQGMRLQQYQTEVSVWSPDELIEPQSLQPYILAIHSG